MNRPRPDSDRHQPTQAERPLIPARQLPANQRRNTVAAGRSSLVIFPSSRASVRPVHGNPTSTLLSENEFFGSFLAGGRTDYRPAGGLATYRRALPARSRTGLHVTGRKWRTPGSKDDSAPAAVHVAEIRTREDRRRVCESDGVMPLSVFVPGDCLTFGGLLGLLGLFRLARRKGRNRIWPVQSSLSLAAGTRWR